MPDVCGVLSDITAGRNVAFESDLCSVAQVVKSAPIGKCVMLVRNEHPGSFFTQFAKNELPKNMHVGTVRTFASCLLNRAVYHDNELSSAIKTCDVKNVHDRFSLVIVEGAHELTVLELQFLRTFVVNVSRPQVLLACAAHADIFCRSLTDIMLALGLFSYAQAPVYHIANCECARQHSAEHLTLDQEHVECLQESGSRSLADMANIMLVLEQYAYAPNARDCSLEHEHVVCSLESSVASTE